MVGRKRGTNECWVSLEQIWGLGGGETNCIIFPSEVHSLAHFEGYFLFLCFPFMSFEVLLPGNIARLALQLQ